MNGHLSKLCLVFVGALSACSDDPEPIQILGRYERVELGFETPREKPAVSVVHQVLPADPIPVGWTIEAKSARVLTQGQASVLELRGEKPRMLQVPLPVPTPDFDRIVVRGVFKARMDITLNLIRGEKVQFKRETSVNAAATPQEVTFDRTRMAGTSNFPVLELVLHQKGIAELISIELQSVPIEDLAPFPTEGPRMVAIKNDSRAGVGLFRDDVLTGGFDVAIPGQSFSYTLSLPAEMRTRALNGAKFHMELTAGEQKVTDEILLEDALGTWIAKKHDLTPFKGQQAKVKFRLEAPGDEELAAILANVWVSHPDEGAQSVVVISSDTHRGDHLGLTSNDLVRTPFLDGLARRGVLFENAWSTTNVTSPSHVALMTGHPPRDSRVIANTGHLADSAPTLAEAFAAAGWATAGVVSVRHLGPRGIGLGQGFEQMRDPVDKPWDAEDAVDCLLAYVDEYEGVPMFLWLHIFDAHDPYSPPTADWTQLYYPEGRDPNDPALPDPPWKMGTVPYHMMTVKDPEYPLAQYRGEVSYLDKELGRVTEHPRLKDHWFAFTSDHGEIIEQQGSWFNHGELYPQTLHVPLIVAGPDVPKGVRSLAHVEQKNVARTMLDLVGMGNEEMPGRNLLASMEAESQGQRFSLSSGGFSAGVGDGRWYLVMTLKEHKTMFPVARKKHQVELYDMDADPECQVDVSADNLKTTQRLRKDLIAWLQEASGAGFASHAAVSPEQMKALAALGYADDMPEVGEKTWFPDECDCERCAELK